MRRFVVLLLILYMSCSAVLAEEEQPKTVWDSIGGWLGQAWEDTSGWVSQAWSDASKWVEGAWGDDSKWVEQAWNDSSEWVTDIWGDVSAWAAETYESATGSIGAWWTETFISVTETAGNPWGWLVEEASTLQPEASATLSNVKEAVMADDDDAETIVKATFIAMLKALKLNDEDSQKVWKTIEAYADQKGISKLAASKLALPYLFQLTVDSAESQDGIPAIAIAQYLTAIVEKLNVNATDDADHLIDQLNEALIGI